MDVGIHSTGSPRTRVFSTNHTGQYVARIADFIAPQGRFGLIDDPESLDIMGLELERAHAMLESGRARGKIVLEGF